MPWDKKSREAHLLKSCRLWCADVLTVPEAELKIRPRRAHHRRDHSVFVISAEVVGAAPKELSFVVPFAADDCAPSFNRVDEYDEAGGRWRTIVDLTVPDDPPEPIKPAKALPLSPKIAYLLLGVAVLVVFLAGGVALQRLDSMVEGISAYKWDTVDGVRGEGWYTYSFTPPGATEPATSSRYDSFMQNRGGREFGVEALDYARLSAILAKPVKVYVNQKNPARSIIAPGVSPLAAAQLLLLFAALIPALLGIRILLSLLRSAKIPKEPTVRIMLPPVFYLCSFVLAMLYVTTYSYVLRTMPPGLPIALWGIVSGILFLWPEMARRLYAIRMVRRAVYFVMVFAMLPPLAIVFGLALPYVLALTTLIMAITVLVRPFARADRKPLYALLISLFWVPFYTAGLLAPCRAIIQVLHEAMPYMPYNLGLTPIENPRLMACLDVGVGLAGIIVSLLLTYTDSLWRGKQAGLVEALPTSRARSVALGLVELQGRAVHVGKGRGAVLQYNSRDLTALRNKPFYLEDDSGRILIDPGESRFRTRWLTSLGGRIVETVLTLREQKPDLTAPHTLTLLPGDPVYVIGTAEQKPGKTNRELGSERLVVKRRSGGVFNSPLWQVAQGRIKPGHEIEDVFFLTDAREKKAKSYIMRGMWQVWVWALFWIILVFLMFHFQLPRTQLGYVHWTMGEIVKYTAGQGRLEAVLAYLDRQPRPLVSPLQQYLEPVPVLGPMIAEINYNQQIAQLSEGTNLLWRNKFAEPAKEEVAILLKALESRSWDARWWAASRLKGATAYHQQAVPALIKVLGSKDDITIRASAASSLAAFGLDALPAVPMLVKAARSDESELQEAALWTVARLPGITGGGGAYELFIELLADPESSHRSFGVQAMRGMGPHARGSASLLLALTADESRYIRSLSLEALQKVAPDFPGYTEAVVKGLSDPEEVVRHRAVYIVNEMVEPPTEVAAPLGRMMTDKSVSDRVNYILSTMGPRAAAAIPYVADGLASEDTKIAYNAAFTLSRVGAAAAPALAELIVALEHEDRFVRRYSAQAIGNIGPEAVSAISGLQPLLNDPDSHVQGAARGALNKLQSR